MKREKAVIAQAFDDGSGDVVISHDPDFDNITLQQDPDTIIVSGKYVEKFIRKLRKVARKAALYPKKKRITLNMRSVGDDTP